MACLQLQWIANHLGAAHTRSSALTGMIRLKLLLFVLSSVLRTCRRGRVGRTGSEGHWEACGCNPVYWTRGRSEWSQPWGMWCQTCQSWYVQYEQNTTCYWNQLNQKYSLPLCIGDISQWNEKYENGWSCCVMPPEHRMYWHWRRGLKRHLVHCLKMNVPSKNIYLGLQRMFLESVVDRFWQCQG